MQITFDNNYVIAVVVFMLTMLFCKNMLECIKACILVSEELMCQDMCFCPCVHKGHAALLRQSILKAFLLFSVFQPLLLLLVKKISESILGYPSFWTVNIGYVLINSDAFGHSTNGTAAKTTPETAFTPSFSEMDVVLLVMPFTLASASSTWTWWSLQHQDFFSSDPEWGPELFSDTRMLLYELLYSLEIFTLMCALFSLAADPAPFEYTIVYSMLLSFLVLFFCCQSRQLRSADQTEQTITMVTLAILHMSTREDTRAGTTIGPGVILQRPVDRSRCCTYLY
jgi:hypothetical protein